MTKVATALLRCRTMASDARCHRDFARGVAQVDGEIMSILADGPRLAQVITQASGQDFHYREAVAVSGGDINSAWRLGDGERCYFVKLNEAAQADMFAAEAQGLAELAAAQVLRVPAVIAHGRLAQQAYLILEWLDLQALDARAQAALGERLAALHRVSGAGLRLASRQLSGANAAAQFLVRRLAGLLARAAAAAPAARAWAARALAGAGRTLAGPAGCVLRRPSADTFLAAWGSVGRQCGHGRHR